MDIRSRHKWWDLQVVKPDAANMAKSGQPPARSFTIGMDANSVDKLSSGPSDPLDADASLQQRLIPTCWSTSYTASFGIYHQYCTEHSPCNWPMVKWCELQAHFLSRLLISGTSHAGKTLLWQWLEPWNRDWIASNCCIKIYLAGVHMCSHVFTFFSICR